MGSPKLDNRADFLAWATTTPYGIKAQDTTDQDWWMMREKIRLLISDYTALPTEITDKLWGSHSVNLNADHHIHVSIDNPGMIAYTSNPDQGLQDRQIRTKFGRYLKNNSGLSLSDPDIAELGSMLRNMMQPSDLLIARSESEIAMVYDEGPRSCMGGEGRVYDHDVAPIRVFASPDCGVAYTMRDDRIVSRALLRMDRMEWIRVYGDETALIPALKRGGYTEGSTLEGCRLKKVMHGGEYVMPYLDGDDNGIDDYSDSDGSWWMVVSHGEYTAEHHETGMLEDDEEDRGYCDSCEESCDQESMVYIDSDDRSVCESCAEYNYSHVYTGQYTELMRSDHDDILGEYNGDMYTMESLSYHDLTYIFDDGEIIALDDAAADEFNSGEMIQKINGTEYTDQHGDAAWTLETDQLVWSREDSTLLDRDHAAQLSNGAWVADDSDLIEIDEMQIKLDFYADIDIEIGVLGLDDVSHDTYTDEISVSLRRFSQGGRDLDNLIAHGKQSRIPAYMPQPYQSDIEGIAA